MTNNKSLLNPTYKRSQCRHSLGAVLLLLFFSFLPLREARADGVAGANASPACPGGNVTCPAGQNLYCPGIANCAQYIGPGQCSTGINGLVNTTNNCGVCCPNGSQVVNCNAVSNASTAGFQVASSPPTCVAGTTMPTCGAGYVPVCSTAYTYPGGFAGWCCPSGQVGNSVYSGQLANGSSCSSAAPTCASTQVPTCGAGTYLACTAQQVPPNGWCCPNGSTANCTGAGGTYCLNPIQPPPPPPNQTTPNQSYPANPNPNPYLGQFGTQLDNCLNNIVGSIPVAGTVLNLAQGAYNAYYNCMGAASTADAVNGCLSTLCNALSAIPNFPAPTTACNINGIAGVVAWCSQLLANVVATFVIPNTMSLFNSGGFFGNCAGMSCRNCVRCISATQGGTNAQYNQGINYCSLRPGGMQTLSAGMQQCLGGFQAGDSTHACMDGYSCSQMDGCSQGTPDQGQGSKWRSWNCQ